MSQFHKLVAGSALVLCVTACGSSEEADPTPHTTPASTTATPTPPAAALDGAIDEALADQGATVWTQRACNACHTIGSGRLVGPDLAGVTTRREPNWIIAMIVNPDSMIRADATAKQLFAEYMTPMANQNIPVGDARALLEYLRRADAPN